MRGCGQFIAHCFFCSFLLRGRNLQPLLLHRKQFSMNCSSLGPSHGVQSSRNRWLQCGLLMGSQPLRHSPALAWGPAWAAGRSLPWLLEHLPSFIDLGVCRTVSLIFTPLWPELLLHSPPLLKHLIPEKLPPLLMGSALASRGSVLEPGGLGSIRHRRSFSQLVTEATPVALPLPKPCQANLTLTYYCCTSFLGETTPSPCVHNLTCEGFRSNHLLTQPLEPQSMAHKLEDHNHPPPKVC